MAAAARPAWHAAHPPSARQTAPAPTQNPLSARQTAPAPASALPLPFSACRGRYALCAYAKCKEMQGSDPPLAECGCIEPARRSACAWGAVGGVGSMCCLRTEAGGTTPRTLTLPHRCSMPRPCRLVRDAAPAEVHGALQSDVRLLLPGRRMDQQQHRLPRRQHCAGAPVARGGRGSGAWALQAPAWLESCVPEHTPRACAGVRGHPAQLDLWRRL